MACSLRRVIPALAALTLIATSGSAASASDLDEPATRYAVTTSVAMPSHEAPEPPTERRFYGWQNIVVGYAGAGSMFATIKTGSTLPILGFGVYALGGPVVHIVHGQYTRAAGSLVINVLTPLLLGAVAHSLDKPCATSANSSENRDCNIDSMSAVITGFAIGMVAAPLIDGLAMGWEERPRTREPEVSVQPTLSIARKEPNGASTTMFGLAGAF
jgi:hypothetical protein